MAKHAGPPESGADDSADPAADTAPIDSGRNLSQDIDHDADPASGSPPERFGRLALWVASASALTVGVMATVAYGVWFDQDQRAYAKAMTVAQQTLATGATVAPAQQTLASGATDGPDQQTPPALVAVVPAQQTLAPGEAVMRDPQPSPTAAEVKPDQQTLTADETTSPAQQTAWSGRVALASPPLTTPITPADTADADPVTSASSAQPGSTEAAASDSFVPHSGSGKCATASCSMKQVRHRPAPHTKPNSGLLARMESLFHHVNDGRHGNGNQQGLYSHS